jgi:hypothetical protein
MLANRSIPLPATYESVEVVQAKRREAERLENLRIASMFESKQNWRAAKVFREAAERLLTGER